MVIKTNGELYYSSLIYDLLVSVLWPDPNASRAPLPPPTFALVVAPPTPPPQRHSTPAAALLSQKCNGTPAGSITLPATDAPPTLHHAQPATLPLAPPPPRQCRGTSSIDIATFSTTAAPFVAAPPTPAYNVSPTTLQHFCRCSHAPATVQALRRQQPPHHKNAAEHPRKPSNAS